MTIFKCEEMMCGHCVSRIDTALTEAKLEHKVDLDNKTVTIEGCENCAAKAAEILDDLGFTPVKIS
ncbi:MAG: heavy-metal-associated domain-containing protein [Lachnospiraceae bacterium]